MDIYIIKKKLGSRKELGRHPVEIDETVNTLGALLYILTLQGLTEAQTPKRTTLYPTVKLPNRLRKDASALLRTMAKTTTQWQKRWNEQSRHTMMVSSKYLSMVKK